MSNDSTVDSTAASSARTKRVHVLLALLAVALLFIALTPNLTRFPVTWFDEGSHLHVPKTLVTYGVYADYSSEGFRYYGPTIGVGPTVMLPIAGVFSLFGIGLLQARLVMAFYLAVSIVLFYVLARRLGRTRFALVATALLLTAQSVSLVEYGRQVLGEVPALVFLLAGLLIWHSSFTRAAAADRSGVGQDFLKLIVVGLLFGLAVVTKNQFLLVMAPSIGLAWLICAVYLRLRKPSLAPQLAPLPHRLFLVPLITMLIGYGIWQIYIVLSLGPSTVEENFRILREATAGAAFVFSTDAMRRAFGELVSARAYGRLLILALPYAALLAVLLFQRSTPKAVTQLSLKPISRDAHFWLVLFIFIAINLLWYAIASIGWPRYAFPGLVLSALFIARLLDDVTNGFTLPRGSFATASAGVWVQRVVRLGIVAWAAFVIISNGIVLVREIVQPPPPAAQEMADYLNANVSPTATIETWEPEMGFLTDHRYHFPPNALLSKSVNYMWSQGTAPSALYNFMEQTPGAPPPQYVLFGSFGQWVGVYPVEVLDQHYRRIAEFGTYQLYELVK